MIPRNLLNHFENGNEISAEDAYPIWSNDLWQFILRTYKLRKCFSSTTTTKLQVVIAPDKEKRRFWCESAIGLVKWAPWLCSDKMTNTIHKTTKTVFIGKLIIIV